MNRSMGKAVFERAVTSALLSLLSLGTSFGQELEGLAAEAFAAEKAIWQAEIDRDVAAFASFLSEDYVQVATGPDAEPSITIGKRAAVEAIETTLETMDFGDYEIETPHARVIDNLVVLTFRSSQTYLPRSGDVPFRQEGVVSTIWVKSENGWRNIHFHLHLAPEKSR